MEKMIIKKYNNQKPITECGKKLITYSKGNLYIKNSDKFIKIHTLYNNSNKKWTNFRILERLLRLSPRCGVDIDGKKILVSLPGKIISVDIKSGELKPEHFYRHKMKHPLQFTKIDGVQGFENSIVYGEYWNNKNREPVSIYRRKIINNSIEWEKAYTFKRGQIKHIHSIVPARIHNCVYVLTGDLDQESGIWRFRNNFHTVDKVLVGEQLYRSCFLKALDNGLLYITDCPDKTNYINFYDFSSNKVKRLEEIDGSCISATALSDGRIIFSTTVEPNEKTMRFYLLNNKRGNGIKDWYSHVYIGSYENGIEEIFKAKKDILPMALFQFGGFSFLETKNNELYGYGTALKKYDNCLIQIELL